MDPTEEEIRVSAFTTLGCPSDSVSLIAHWCGYCSSRTVTVFISDDTIRNFLCHLSPWQERLTSAKAALEGSYVYVKVGGYYTTYVYLNEIMNLIFEGEYIQLITTV